MFVSILTTACLACAQGTLRAGGTESLADAARREAERREGIDRLGIDETVIEGNGGCLAGDGNVSLSEPAGRAPAAPVSSGSSGGDRSSLRRYRTKLQTIEKGIQKDEARILKLRERLEDLRRKSLRLTDLAAVGRNDATRDDVRKQLEKLEADLRRKQGEKRKIYDSGRRDGFLPGELEGRGVVP